METTHPQEIFTQGDLYNSIEFRIETLENIWKYSKKFSYLYSRWFSNKEKNRTMVHDHIIHDFCFTFSVLADRNKFFEKNLEKIANQQGFTYKFKTEKLDPNFGVCKHKRDKVYSMLYEDLKNGLDDGRNIWKEGGFELMCDKGVISLKLSGQDI